ncbi:MAG: tripartite tricarboxylate transporter TctB family protein [Burkholderiales bacterium]
MTSFPPRRLAAGILGLLALAFAGASWKLGYWGQGLPGPGLLPLATSVLLLPAAVLLLRAPPTEEEAPALAARSLAGLALCTACALAMPALGMVVPSVALATVWMRLWGGRSWIGALLYAAAIVGALALLFVSALGVPVPLWPARP